jgi:hypothetical protein
MEFSVYLQHGVLARSVVSGYILVYLKESSHPCGFGYLKRQRRGPLNLHFP